MEPYTNIVEEYKGLKLRIFDENTQRLIYESEIPKSYEEYKTIISNLTISYNKKFKLKFEDFDTDCIYREIFSEAEFKKALNYMTGQGLNMAAEICIETKEWVCKRCQKQNLKEAQRCVTCKLERYK